LITLEAGDLILTGTPAGASVIKPGDRVEVEVDAPGAPGEPTSGRLVTTVTAGELPLREYGAGPKIDEATRADAWGSRGEQATPTTRTPLTEEVLAALREVGTATLSSQLRKRGLDNVSIDGVAPLRAGERLIGTARTLRMVPLREDLFKSHGGGYNAQKRAVDTLEPGDVLVIEARGERGTGTIGDILALRAQVRGAAGVVTDGGVRDHDAVAGLGLPVYCAGAHPAVLGRRHVPWDVDQTIACGGTTVQPGDVIVGDADGVLVIPPGLVAEVAADAVEQERQETFIAEQVAAGEPVDGLYPMNESWREKYRQWRP
jgi:regulator of RNase E activity RraA